MRVKASGMYKDLLGKKSLSQPRILRLSQSKVCNLQSNSTSIEKTTSLSHPTTTSSLSPLPSNHKPGVFLVTKRKRHEKFCD